MKKYFYIGLSALSLLVMSCTEKIQETGRIAFTVSEAVVAADVVTKAEVDINTLDRGTGRGRIACLDECVHRLRRHVHQ